RILLALSLAVCGLVFAPTSTTSVRGGPEIVGLTATTALGPWSRRSPWWLGRCESGELSFLVTLDLTLQDLHELIIEEILTQKWEGLQMSPGKRRRPIKAV
ncbi:hypothetical protein, partial [Salmonella sp. s51944]|uniref:hypothetical protein n=1 Tax=Salmonella sp. s51944 TaxID=3159655 RepID=UPI00397F96AE